MNITKVNEETFWQERANIRKAGKGQSELAQRIEEMEAGECISIDCESDEEFVRARNIVALFKSRSRLGEFMYAASRKNRNIVVRRVKP